MNTTDTPHEPTEKEIAALEKEYERVRRAQGASKGTIFREKVEMQTFEGDVEYGGGDVPPQQYADSLKKETAKQKESFAESMDPSILHTEEAIDKAIDKAAKKEEQREGYISLRKAQGASEETIGTEVMSGTTTEHSSGESIVLDPEPTITNAIKSFQKQIGLKPTGIVDDVTKAGIAMQQLDIDRQLAEQDGAIDDDEAIKLRSDFGKIQEGLDALSKKDKNKLKPIEGVLIDLLKETENRTFGNRKLLDGMIDSLETARGAKSSHNHQAATEQTTSIPTDAVVTALNEDKAAPAANPKDNTIQKPAPEEGEGKTLPLPDRMRARELFEKHENSELQKKFDALPMEGKLNIDKDLLASLGQALGAHETQSGLNAQTAPNHKERGSGRNFS